MSSAEDGFEMQIGGVSKTCRFSTMRRMQENTALGRQDQPVERLRKESIKGLRSRAMAEANNPKSLAWERE